MPQTESESAAAAKMRENIDSMCDPARLAKMKPHQLVEHIANLRILMHAHIDGIENLQRERGN